jgi:hypothetical protein
MRPIPDDYHVYTSFGSPIDLYTSNTRPRPAIVLKVEAGSGTVDVKMAGSHGTPRQLTVAAGEEIFGAFMSIEAVSGVTKLRVGWG